jgi:hypothetical protein
VKKIFLSYRRQDTAVFTGRLYDRLIDYFGQDFIFLDIDSIPNAADFRVVVRDCISSCGVFLAVIGKHWAGPLEQGRRIDDPADYVRIEVELALEAGKPVIPVYADKAEPLKPAELPSPLQALVFANASFIDTGKDFNHHVQGLRKSINRILFPSRWQYGQYLLLRFLRKRWVTLLSILLVALVVAAFRAPISRWLMPSQAVHAALEGFDAGTFYKGHQGRYEIARALADRTALVAETDLVKTIRETRRSFDAFALTGSAFFNNPEAITDAIRNGAKFRFLLYDHSVDNYSNLQALLRDTRFAGSIEWSTTNARQAAEALNRLKETVASQGLGSDCIEVRHWRGIYLNSFWVRDASDSATAQGHCEVTYYGDQLLNPSMRFGQFSPKMISSLKQQFDYMWSKAVP